ncbi:hypothetical protein BU24DRAFT_488332 [Aaosphaeria arxii CBS 175.79]|uniref:Zn(2)-C6 fungal-type domain-containing protein n=1 Tax=Aaosphaeria arxii CBS 175.79 TaxID=1450172 RepID=A0A6A5YBP2_9PLEO|nr:uncharacterized protein BU24DRAFT_488332 [Aaosphaeria arxii CBS 175.79]KAF2022024.1 hypothetical protein BU24DRAFT_488332 [Aaosphaeria arxii CBS 175.79]
MGAQLPQLKAQRGCWTCKSRKIGCDRSLPCCKNCLRTDRTCKGYGPRLVWRTSATVKPQHVQAYWSADSAQRLQDYGTDFLTFNVEDMDLAEGRIDWHSALVKSLARPRCAFISHRSSTSQQGAIFSYYIQVVAPMCSTTHFGNGLWQELPSIALSAHDASTEALLHSMIGISVHHLRGSDAALPFKMKAVQALTRSLAHSAACVKKSTLSQLAAVMMICMHSVFDADDGYFYVHLEGARQILLDLGLRYGRSQLTEFLTIWLMYYDVLSSFAHPLRQSHRTLDASFDRIILQDDPTIIIGILGCSIEVFNAIRRINILRARILLKRNETSESIDKKEHRPALEAMLQNATQQLSRHEIDYLVHAKRAEVLAKAELYRLAALLYLQRVVPADGDEGRRAAYLQQALSILSRLTVASSPWPCFIVACEVTLEEQRSQILKALHDMDAIRRIGNVHATRAIIETIWKQQDLRGGVERVGWWSCTDFGLSVPWFV